MLFLSAAPDVALLAPAEPVRKVAIGIDGQFLLPVGHLADTTNPLLGPLVRFGYRIGPTVELTLRGGYLSGLTKQVDAGRSSLSLLPIWTGARFFFTAPQAGVYAATEISLGFGSTSVGRFGDVESKSATRIGFNVGAGYVISKALPVDVRLQLAVLNPLLKDAGEKTQLAVGLSAGYTFEL